MSAADFALLQPHLRREPLNRLDVLTPPNTPIETIHFPEGALVSIVAIGPQAGRTEVGIFGRDGMSGVSVLLGSLSTPHETYVQVDSATSLNLPAAALIEAVNASVTLRTLLLRFSHFQMVQIADALSAMATCTLERRLARWLLMCQDRIDGDELAITHEFMGMMLGTRRAGVTDALHILEGDHLVRAARGKVTVLDRDGLVRLAGDAYGKPEAEYRRLIGPMPYDQPA